MISPGPALLSRVYFTCSTRHDICPKLHRWIFRPKKFTLLFSPDNNSFRDKNTKMSVYGWRNLHRWQIFYTPTGKDGRDKSHLCVPCFSFIFAHKNRWLLGWKLQGGLFTKRRCAVPDFAASCQHFPLSWNTERAFCSHSPF